MFRSILFTLVLIAPGFGADADLITENNQSHVRGINIAVIQGEGVVNLLPAAPPTNITIRVTDGGGQPIVNGVAVFQMPEGGPSGVFDDETGSPTKVVLTDARGQASVLTRANAIPGRFDVTITVNALGQTGKIALHQENRQASEARPVPAHELTSRTPRHKGSILHSKAFWIAAAACAGGAVAVLARGHHGSTAPTDGGIVITPGSGTVGGN